MYKLHATNPKSKRSEKASPSLAPAERMTVACGGRPNRPIHGVARPEGTRIGVCLGEEKERDLQKLLVRWRGK